MAHKSLINAMNNPNDEIYTRREDIAAQFDQYSEFFKDKSICLPCDFGNFSEFWNYFRDNFDEFSLRRLDCFGRNPAAPASGVHGVITRGDDGRSGFASFEYGPEFNDFRSPVVSLYAAKSDIIITNPPFSLGAAFRHWLLKINNPFAILSYGNCVWLQYSYFFEYIAAGELVPGDFVRKYRFGKNCPNSFLLFRFPKSANKTFIQYEPAPGPDIYLPPPYADVLYIDKCKHIKRDYPGRQCVPINFLRYADRDDFDILEQTRNIQRPGDDGRELYSRFIIQRKAAAL